MNITELQSILLAEVPSALLREREEELFRLIPPLQVCKGFAQNNPWHIYDVYDHILKVVDGVPREWAVRLAALFHDVGKPPVYHEDERGIGHFYGHWDASAELFDAFAQGQGLEAAFAQRVRELILYHDINIGQLSDEKLDALLGHFDADGLRWLFAIKRADLLAQNPQYHGLLEDYARQEERAQQRRSALWPIT